MCSWKITSPPRVHLLMYTSESSEDVCLFVFHIFYFLLQNIYINVILSHTCIKKIDRINKSRTHKNKAILLFFLILLAGNEYIKQVPNRSIICFPEQKRIIIIMYFCKILHFIIYCHRKLTIFFQSHYHL